MTLSEFKAWFEGYTEGLEGAPTKAQFDRIKEKVKEISGTPITYPIYVDRYVQPYRPMWDRYWTWSDSGYGISTVALSAGNDAKAAYASNAGGDMLAFDSREAMYHLGRAEAAN